MEPKPTKDLGWAVARLMKAGCSLELFSPNDEGGPHQHIYIEDARILRDFLNEHMPQEPKP